MAISQTTLKLRQGRKALSRELHNPTPERKAAEARYLAENPDLFKPKSPK